MQEKIESIKLNLNESIKKSFAHFESELSKIRAGRASASILDDVKVDYYGSPTPMNQVANIQILDARTISIIPWEKSMLAPIEKAIMAANIGITPQNDGNQVRLYLPILTEERRKELSKKVSFEGEQAKIAVRSLRRDAIENIKKLQKEGLSEDQMNANETDIQSIIDKNMTHIDKLVSIKEQEIMHV
ncbi:MAG: ribosome recycling factor [Alphaproteobacteria bacterium]|nr:ribosome recycling factor [Alphaproteobacteria bacterium]